MTGIGIAIAVVAVTLVLILLGMRIPLVLISMSYFGIWMVDGSAVFSGKLVALSITTALSNYYYATIPLFVLLGLTTAAAGIGRDVFDVVAYVFRHARAGTAISTVGANTVFAAATGSSVASAAVFSKIAVPEMERVGLSRPFAASIVAGSSVLGMLIPPSVLMILFALLTNQPVGDMFIAGILPGCIMALVFAIGVNWLAGRQKNNLIDAPQMPPVHKPSIATMVPIGALATLILGGIYGGWITPVEAGALGCLFALAIGFARRRINVRVLRDLLSETGSVTATICFLILGAQLFSRFLALSGVQPLIEDTLLDGSFGYWQLIFGYIMLLIVLGTVLDAASTMLLVVPLMLPVIVSLGIDPIWFGVVTVIAVEIGLLTPPFGLAIFVVKNALQGEDVGLRALYIGTFPFVVMTSIVLGLVVCFPALATALL